ncbi:hypothetical protein V9T40_006207 [Parthenolecanium corni]|uniref:Uncharacterized protein n=1 Tax=Parthenolecanium corni TaxID=536013 RepID=A0AAN9TVF3_9HEMI
MTSIWEEDPNVYDAHYWRCRKKLDMTPESIKRDVHQLQLWLKNHPYLPRLTGVDEKKWLENYLVLNKNDVERTKKNLDLYFKIRTTLPEGFTNRQAHSADMYQSFKAVCLAIPPKLTKEGYMVVVFNHLNPCVSDFEVVPFAKRMVSMIDIQLRTVNLTMAEVEDNNEGMRQKFNRGIETLLATKRADNSAFMTADEYRDQIEAVKAAKEALQTCIINFQVLVII